MVDASLRLNLDQPPLERQRRTTGRKPSKSRANRKKDWRNIFRSRGNSKRKKKEKKGNTTHPNAATGSHLIREDTEALLRAFYREPNGELGELLGRPMDWPT